ncbi:MAG: hypothetical protein GY729_15050 [Desulfobacteraceae bacterium]|nr:hypothetical protein [Desulfobacteraceae bacterium]
MTVLKKIVIIVPVICGIALFIIMKNTKQEPVRVANRERVCSIRVISLQKTFVIPRSNAYGYVEPERKWEAFSEVSGQIVEIHPNLEKGNFIKKGELLIKIDTATYGLAETKGKADVMSVDAQLRELEQSRKNTQRLLEIEKKSLSISARELKRKRELHEKGYASKSDLEKEERTFLAQQTLVNNLQNTLDLIPSRKNALMAKKKSGESTVTQRQLDVAKAEIYAPFNCRLSAVNVELDQYAAAGTLLLVAEGIDAMEIPVQVSPREFMKILPRTDQPFLPETLSMETFRKAIGITAKVRLPLTSEKKIQWEGRFSRTSESMDLKTGALTVYITVDKPYANVIPGRRPPLLTHMYVKVQLQGRPLPDRFVIPRSAVHEGKVYICSPENRLEIKPVDVEFFMEDLAVLSNGLEPGQLLVLTDLAPAVEGMLLDPVKDKETALRVKAQSLGEDG